MIETNNASEPGVERRGVQAKLVAIERHAGFEAQGVAAGIAGRNQTNRTACAQNRAPGGHSILVFDQQFETVFTGVTGASKERVSAVELALENRVVLEVVERCVGERLENLNRARALNRDERVTRSGVVESYIKTGSALVES